MDLPGFETSLLQDVQNVFEEPKNELEEPEREKKLKSLDKLLIEKYFDKEKWWEGEVNILAENGLQALCGPDCCYKSQENRRIGNHNVTSNCNNFYFDSNDKKKMLNKPFDYHSDKSNYYQICEKEGDKESEFSKPQSSDIPNQEEETNGSIKQEAEKISMHRINSLEDLENVKNQAQNIHSHSMEELQLLKLESSGKELIRAEEVFKEHSISSIKEERDFEPSSHVLEDQKDSIVQTLNQEKGKVSEKSNSQIPCNDFITSVQDSKQEMLDGKNHILDHFENDENQFGVIERADKSELLKLQSSGSEFIISKQDLKEDVSCPVKQENSENKSSVLDNPENVQNQSLNMEGKEEWENDKKASVNLGPSSRSYIWDYISKVKNQTFYPLTIRESELLKWLSSGRHHVGSNQDVKSLGVETEEEKSNAAGRTGWGYVWENVSKVKNQTLPPWINGELEMLKPLSSSRAEKGSENSELTELTSRSHLWDYVFKIKNQTLHPLTDGDFELRSWLSSGRDYNSSKQDIMSANDKTDQELGDAADGVSAGRGSVWDYVNKVRNQTLYPWRAQESKLSIDQASFLPNSDNESVMSGMNSKSVVWGMGTETDKSPESATSSMNNLWDYVAKVKNQTLYPWRSDEPERPQSNVEQDTVALVDNIGQGKNEKPQGVTSRKYLWDYVTKVKNQTLWRAEEAELFEDQSANLHRSENDPIQGPGEMNKSHVLGYFTGKLSDAYKDAERRLQGTRDFIRNVGVSDMKYAVSQYVNMMSKDLPLIQQTKLQPQSNIVPENKVKLVDLSSTCLHSGSQGFGLNAASLWIKGSVSSIRNTGTENSHPEEFYQGLVEFPPALTELRGLSSQQILEKIQSPSTERSVKKILSVFWLRAASYEQSRPKPVSLLLSEEGLTVISAEEDTLSLFHHFDLIEIKEVQISLGGQHVRLIGSSEDSVLAVFTYNQELTQDFCKALLKASCPQKIFEVMETHPLLSEDLMALCLDWTSRVPDIVLDSGLKVTSRFKRVLADLFYIIHGNMDGPDKPSLANIHPLLYTSVRVTSSGRGQPDSLFQFLLTDSHVGLLQEDGVFHPVPRGSSKVPVQPQFQGLKLRRRSDIRCLLVRRNESCFGVDVVFINHYSQSLKRRVEFRHGSADVPFSSKPRDSWKLTFGCSSEAQMLINHLCI